MDNFPNENQNNGFSGFDEAVSRDEYTENENYGVPNDRNDYAQEQTDTAADPVFDTTENTDGDGFNTSPVTPPARTSFFPNGSYGEANENSYTPPKAVPNVVYDPKPPKMPKPPKPEKEGKHYGIGSLIAVALITSIVTSGCFWAFSKMNETGMDLSGTKSDGTNSTPKTEQVVEINGSIEQLAEAASDKAGASVVAVQTEYAVDSFFLGQSTSSGSGSGVIYKSDGYIITNFHVIQDTLETNNSKITVYLDNNTEKGYTATVINYNISCDLAVLKINKSGLPAIEIANSDKLKVGQYVVCIGSPAGIEFMGSTTFGIISGLNRKLSTTNGALNLVQTDAAINPGNSGGALVNTKGQLVGISSSKLVDGGYEGMGFAIPSNTVAKICDDLIAHEGEGSPYTGISVSTNYSADFLRSYGYPAGAVVAGVDEGSPANNAGIQRGDIITKFGDNEIEDYSDYDTALANYFPGDKIKVEFYRSGRNETVTVTIGSTN